MTKDYEDRLIELKNNLLTSLDKGDSPNHIENLIRHLLGYIEALEDLRKGK